MRMRYQAVDQRWRDDATISALTFKELSLKIGIVKSFKDFFKEFRFLRIFLRNFRNILCWTKNVGGRITTPRKCNLNLKVASYVLMS
jgi:hypothetical protein